MYPVHRVAKPMQVRHNLFGVGNSRLNSVHANNENMKFADAVNEIHPARYNPVDPRITTPVY